MPDLTGWQIVAMAAVAVVALPFIIQAAVVCAVSLFAVAVGVAGVFIWGCEFIGHAVRHIRDKASRR